MEWIVYFVGFMLINMATSVGIPKEHRIELFSYASLIQQVMIILGELLIHYRNILK